MSQAESPKKWPFSASSKLLGIISMASHLVKEGAEEIMPTLLKGEKMNI
jgi:hypothetical protein